MEEEKTDETINPEINPEILRIHTDMSRVISAAEAAGLEGNIDLVQVSLLIWLREVSTLSTKLILKYKLTYTVDQELVFIKLEELQKEKNAVLVSTLR